MVMRDHVEVGPMRGRNGRGERIDAAPRLALVLLRHSLGLSEQRELAAALDVAASQVSMWERGERPVPEEALERAARLRGLAPPLLAQLLREIRAFLRAVRRTSGAGQMLAGNLAAELVLVLVESLNLVPAPGSVAIRPEVGAEERWRDLAECTAEERRVIVEEGEEYQTLELAERVRAESAALAAARPREARELEELAELIAELAGTSPAETSPPRSPSPIAPPPAGRGGGR
jgi:transcriptional regulator with XRE-family HTH domain